MDPFGRSVFYGAWGYYRFIAGGAVSLSRSISHPYQKDAVADSSTALQAYVLLTVMVLSSFNPIRKRFYEVFYYSHVVLTIAFLVTTILHFEDLAYWSYAAAGLWAVERFVRLVVLTRINIIRSRHVDGKGGQKEQHFESGFEVIRVEKSDGYVDSETWNGIKLTGAAREDKYQPPGLEMSDEGGSIQMRSYYEYGPGQEVP